MGTKFLNVEFEFKNLQTRQFEGHGATFGNVDLGGDIVVPGAFKRSLAKMGDNLPPMLWSHDPTQIPGKWLEMGEDNVGLAVKGEFADTQLGKETRTLLAMGAVKGMSIGYITHDWDFDNDGNRLLKEVEVVELSVVAIPMNPEAQVSAVKSMLGHTGPRLLEERLRDVGCSKNAAKAVIHDLLESGGMPDDEIDDDVVKEFAARNERLMADIIQSRFKRQTNG